MRTRFHARFPEPLGAKAMATASRSKRCFGEKKDASGRACCPTRGGWWSNEGSRVGTLAARKTNTSHGRVLRRNQWRLHSECPDQRQAITWTPPVALNVPGLDGWLSARLKLQKTSDDRISEGFVDAGGTLYSSAARHFSFYAAIGADKLPSSDADDPGARRPALEGGFKLRIQFPA